MSLTTSHCHHNDSKGRLFLVDGASLCYRAFYAVRELTTSRGQPTNAVYGIITMIRKLLEEEKPEYIGVAFDRREPTFRHQKYEGYKQHRKPMPDALVSQLPIIKEVLAAFRIPVFEKAGYEADDIMGTIALQAVKHGLAVYLVTSDKDMLQLVGAHIKVYRPTRDGHDIVDDKNLHERWSLKSDQVVDVMALMGDDSDAIPGVPGIGEKTAVELIQKFGSLDKMLKNIDQIPGAARQKAIEDNREQIQMSRELATLDTNVLVTFEWDDLKKQEPNTEALRVLYQTLEFKSLLKEIKPVCAPADHTVTTLRSRRDIEQIIRKIRAAGQAAVVIMANSNTPMQADIAAVALAWEKAHAYVLGDSLHVRDLEPLLTDSRCLKICPQLKETIILLERQGVSLSEPWTDPCLASYLLEPSRPSHEIPELASEFLHDIPDVSDPQERAALYAVTAVGLYPILAQHIEEKNCSTLLKEIEVPLSAVLARMERYGVALDQKELKAIEKQMDRTLEQLTSQIYAQAGESFNMNSPKQLAGVLFQRLKLPVIKKTKTGASTDEEVLNRLSALHDLPRLILQYRELAKLNSTYVKALPVLIHPKTGKIHTSFHQTVTATGRLSSSNPNLQNIPIRTEIGRQIRKAFVPFRKGDCFLAADYSQIELRILAHLSADEGLMRAFREGEDIHRVTAAEIFHVSPGSVTSDQRAAAKTINFGIVYGMTPFGLSKELGIDQGQAAEFIQRYFARYSKVQSYMKGVLEEARRNGYSCTMFNRRRYIPELSAKDPVLRQFAERTAINAPIQGSAADLIKITMIALDKVLQKEKLHSAMVLQIHDELIFEVPEKELSRMKSLVKETMESPRLEGRPIQFSVPIEVKLKIGNNWLEASST